MKKSLHQTVLKLLVCLLVAQAFFGSLPMEAASVLTVELQTNGQPYYEEEVATDPVTIYVTVSTSDSANVQISQDLGASWQPFDRNLPLILEEVGTHYIWLRIEGQEEVEKRQVRIAPSPKALAALATVVVYVDADASGNNDGSSWANAFTDLQSALASTVGGEEIWIAEGIYKPTAGVDRGISFKMKDNVAIYGGFAGTEQIKDERNLEDHPTILSGDIGVANDKTDNSYHVFHNALLNETAILDSVIIRDGVGELNGGGINARYGGGMFNETNSSPTLNNVQFEDNESLWGGGIANLDASSPSLNNVRFKNNRASYDGAGMLNEDSGNLILQNVQFEDNRASNSGGGIANKGDSNLTLMNVQFKNNQASGNGGGILTAGDSLTLINIQFEANTAYNGGGLISFGSGDLDLTEVFFENNTAIRDGGGMYNGNLGNSKLVNVQFKGNEGDNGGGMYSGYGSPKLINVQFENNKAANDGGGMYNEGSSPELDNVQFKNNVSDEDGGGMFNRNSNPVLENVQFEGNTAVEDGAGMFNTDASELTLTDVMFKDNVTNLNGGGIYNRESNLKLENVQFKDNMADESGGGIFNTNVSESTLIHVMFEGNNANLDGGGISNESSHPTLINVQFKSNTATDYGGGLNNIDSNPVLINGLFQENTVLNGEGNAIFNAGNSKTILTNVTMTHNGAQNNTYATIYSNPASVTDIRNSLIVGNNGVAIDGSTTMAYSIVGDAEDAIFYDAIGQVSGEVFKATEIFRDFAQVDLRLREGSPAINKGNNAFNSELKDLARNPRVQGASIDLGAYETALYTIIYDKNGATSGDVPTDAHEYVTDASVIIADNIGQLRKAGFIFAGWNTNRDGSGVDYKAGDTFNMGVANITLYAKWEVAYHTLAFATNGGSVIASQSVAYQQKATEPATPTRTGYTFAGWYKDAQLTEQWNFTTDVVTQNITLYAKWTAKPIVTPPVSGGGGSTPSITYTVQFQTNGGTAITAQTKDYNDKIVEPVPPTKEGYTFAGWYIDIALTKEWHFDTDVVKESMTLYAKWVKNAEDEVEQVEPPIEKPPVSTCPIQFIDIATHWAKDMIEDIAGRCWIKGYPDSTFKPNDPIQRQHVAVIFARAFDLPATREMQDFTDVSASHRYYDAIAKMYQAGVFDGVDGKFKPEAPMTRAHMAKVLVQVFDLTSDGTSTFQDVPAIHWAKDYIVILADNEIALGDNGNFKPNDPVTRAQFVAFMYRAMHIIEK
ncbi:InlB B-repeat-containing protein [Bacillus ndiopicus]|uniref:InlB B-repeat-containing protein n=1 Tax=Bacillus ndiopicus TaxID=1347368 RepID=UPI000693371B|nr:InlB B-repeat-containing protein [Bacillus ndiopicus]